MTEEREDTEGRNTPSEIIALSFSAGNKKSLYPFIPLSKLLQNVVQQRTWMLKSPDDISRVVYYAAFELGTDKVTNDWRADQMPQRR